MADRIMPSQDGSGLPVKYHDNGDGTFSPVVWSTNTAGGTFRTFIAPDAGGLTTKYRDNGDGSFAPTVRKAP